MHFRLFATAALVLAATAAPAADKALSSMNQPLLFPGTVPPPLTLPASPNWINGTSKGKMKFLSTCKVLVKLTGTTLGPSDGVAGTGDEVICLAEFNMGVPFGGPAGLVLRGEVSNAGSVTISRDLGTEGLCPFPFSPGVTDVSDLRVTCYEPSGAYVAPISIPFSSDPTQGLAFFIYPPRPVTGLLATDSIRF